MTDKDQAEKERRVLRETLRALDFTAWEQDPKDPRRYTCIGRKAPRKPGRYLLSVRLEIDYWHPSVAYIEGPVPVSGTILKPEKDDNSFASAAYFTRHQAQARAERAATKHYQTGSWLGNPGPKE